MTVRRLGCDGSSVVYAKDEILHRFILEFGPWSTSTKKVIRWEIVPEVLHVALLEADCGTVIIPWNEGRDAKPYFGDIYYARFLDGQPVEEGRSSNIVAYAPSLGWDRDILYLHAMTEEELRWTIEFVRQKKLGVPLQPVRARGESPRLGIGSKRRGPGRGGSIPWSVVRQVFDRDERRCRWCGSTERLQIDHIIPQAKGGSDQVENLQVLCEHCNLSKSHRI